jgi:acetylornithine deacetylase
MATRTDEQMLRTLDEAILARRDDLVAATQALVRFETVSADLAPGSEFAGNQEAELQAWIAERLAAIGCGVDQWEPDPAELGRHPMIPSWHHWRGRPITVATLRGAGGGRSLIVNGHVDVVDPGDPALWSSPPFAAEVRDGHIFGRGTVDMKGGIAAALIALETLVAAGVQLAGDVIFQVVTDEETGGMGTIAAAERGYRADAAVVPEATGLDVWTVTRGILHARLAVPGRSAHAEVNQPHWRDGGGVNANHKALRIATELVALGERRRADAHPLLGPPSLHVTALRGGAFVSNMPERCEVTVNATYLPAQADERGFGSFLRAELEAVVAEACRDDDWLSAHPPEWTWLMDYPPGEIDPAAGVVAAARTAARAVGREARLAGLDSGYDCALLAALYGIPSPAFGPGDIAQAHTTDESIAIDDLVEAARAYARLLVDWCGPGRPTV